MNNSPANYPLNCTINAIPARSKNGCCFLPAQSLGPGSQEDSIRNGLLVVSACPWNSFCGNPALTTIDSSHSVNKEHSNRPKWNKLKPPGCRMIIGRSFHAAVIANRFRTMPCSERELDLACFGHACLGIYEALLLFYAIEDSL